MDYEIHTTTEKLNSTGGMALVGKILERISFCKRAGIESPRYPHVLKSLIGLFTQGRTHFEEIDMVRNDTFFKDSFNLEYVPAKETTRLYLEKMICEKTLIDLETETSTINLLKSGKLTPLDIKGLKYLPIVKRNLRKEKSEYWMDIAQAEGAIIHQDESKTVYVGVHTGRKPAQDEALPDIDVVFQVTERRRAKDGTRLLFPELEIETFWTNMYENPETVIELYHDHGTSEQFHSELKTDMGIERLPSGKFVVNAIVLKLAMLSFNILRFIGQSALGFKESLPYKIASKRKRLRKVIDDLIRVAVKIVQHARQTCIRLWEKDPWYECFSHVYQLCCNL